MTLKKIRTYSVLIATILVMSIMLVACGFKLDLGNDNVESIRDKYDIYILNKPSNQYLMIGEKFRLRLSINRPVDEDVNIVWESSDGRVISIEDDNGIGVLTAVSTNSEDGISDVVTIKAYIYNNADSIEPILDENGDLIYDSVELIVKDEEHIKVMEFINKHQEWVDSFVNMNPNDLPTDDIDWYAEWYTEYSSLTHDFNDNFVNYENGDALIEMSPENTELLSGFYYGVTGNVEITNSILSYINDNVNEYILYMMNGLPTFGEDSSTFIMNLKGNYFDIVKGFVDKFQKKFYDFKSQYENDELSDYDLRDACNRIIDEDLKYLGYFYYPDYSNINSDGSIHPDENTFLYYWINIWLILVDVIDDSPVSDHEIVSNSLNQAVFDDNLNRLFGTTDPTVVVTQGDKLYYSGIKNLIEYINWFLYADKPNV